MSDAIYKIFYTHLLIFVGSRVRGKIFLSPTYSELWLAYL